MGPILAQNLGARRFDRVRQTLRARLGFMVVAVAAGHHKRTMFTIDERLEIAQELAAKYPNVEVIDFRGLLRDFVVGNDGNVVVRGLRAVSDFDYEFQMVGMNRRLDQEIETVFLMADPRHQAIASKLVKEIAVLGGNISKFVSPGVRADVIARVAEFGKTT